MDAQRHIHPNMLHTSRDVFVCTFFFLPFFYRSSTGAAALSEELVEVELLELLPLAGAALLPLLRSALAFAFPFAAALSVLGSRFSLLCFLLLLPSLGGFCLLSSLEDFVCLEPELQVFFFLLLHLCAIAFRSGPEAEKGCRGTFDRPFLFPPGNPISENFCILISFVAITLRIEEFSLRRGLDTLMLAIHKLNRIETFSCTCTSLHALMP